jgi:hypothetical protein
MSCQWSPTNTSYACPQIKDEEDKGRTRSTAVKKKRNTATWGVMWESGRLGVTSCVDCGGFITVIRPNIMSTINRAREEKI